MNPHPPAATARPTPWMLRLIALVSLGLALVLTAPATAPASTSPDYYGLNVQTLFRLDSVAPERWGAFLDQMRNGGMTRARIDAHWQYAEPNPPKGGQHTYTWSRPWDPRSSMDHQARLLASRGIRMVPVLSHAPDWAAQGGTRLHPSHYGDFAAFTAAFARRYGPGGDFWRENPDVPALPVHEYELWTEANSTIFWTGGPNPAEYVAALRPVRDALRRADASAKLLASLGWQDFENYTRRMYAAGAQGLIDGVGFHPYAPHAPAIIALVRRMRETLRALGDGALPIWLTETGQPVTFGRGGALADSGLVSDAARAATQSLTGDALARSDCDVRDFQVYTIVASETNREPIAEGFMGVMRLADAQPNVTGSALMRSSLRWRARQDGGIVICGAGETPKASLLPLDLQIDHTSPTCVKGRTTYDGNPIEAALMNLSTADGRVAPGYVNAFGESVACIPDGPPVWEFEVISEVKNIAASQRYRCTVPREYGTPPPGLCRVVEEPLPLASAPTATATVAKRAAICRWQASAKVVAARPKRATLKAGVGCRVTPKQAKFTLSVRKGRSSKRVRTVTLRPGETSMVTLPRKLRRGERIVLANKADLKRKMPRLVARTAAIGGADVAGTEGCDWKLEARVLGGARSKAKRTKVRARLTCPPVPARSLRFTIAVKAKKAKKAKKIRSVTLRGGRVGNVTLKRRLKVGDRVILSRTADAVVGIPTLTARATTSKKVLRRR
ncbi:MAG: hypothetical protein ACSLFR_09875 [Solirubrobacteraceae bacterium]